MQDPGKLERLIIGSGTCKAYEAVVDLVNSGVKVSNIRIHLGYVSNRSSYGYRPMMHGKTFHFNKDNTSKGIVGSHNLTNFAFNGSNAEASIELEGEESSKSLSDILCYINACWAEASSFDPSKIEGYAEWTKKYLSSISRRTNPISSNDGIIKKEVLFGVLNTKGRFLPGPSDSIYLEVPISEKGLRKLDIDVHLHFRMTGPSSLRYWMDKTQKMKDAYICEVTSTGEVGEVSTYNVDFASTLSSNYTLESVGKPYQPTPSPEVYQVVLRVKNVLNKRYHYFENLKKKKWTPILSHDTIQEGPMVSDEEKFGATENKLNREFNGYKTKLTKPSFKLIKDIRLEYYGKEEREHDDSIKQLTPLLHVRGFKEL
jgi:hypothetical protein